MRKLSDLEYLKLNKFQAFWYNVLMFFCAIPGWFVKLFAAQLGGRLLRAIAVLIAVYALDVQTIGVASIWSMVQNGLLGIVLQWCILPLLLFRLHAAENKDA